MQKRECFAFCSVLSKKVFKKQDMVFSHDMVVMRKHTNNKKTSEKKKQKKQYHRSLGSLAKVRNQNLHKNKKSTKN